MSTLGGFCVILNRNSLIYLSLGQVWYLIVSIPDFCTLTYFTYLSHNLNYARISKRSKIYKKIKEGSLKKGFFIIKTSILINFDINEGI